MAGTLYLVGTPIGNLGDFSPRAAETLEKVDFIAAEDTRVTLKLLSHLGIKKELVSYHEHNQRQRGPQILERLQNGESCALCSDAGMPCISDPGEELVRLCAQHGIPVQSVPGPTAAMTALALSGLSVGRFTFEGFLSVKKGSREEHLASLKEEPRTMVFYEAPHKLPSTLKDLLRVLGDRKIALCRELTKVYEEVHRTTLAQAAAYYEEHPPRGEFVLVVEGAPPKKESQVSRKEALALVQQLCGEGMSLSAAAREAARRTGHPKGELYRAALEEEE